MIAELALVLALAAPQATSPEAAPAPPSAGEMSAPNPRAEKLQLEIDALRQQNAERLQLQIDTLRERPSLIPPLILMGVSVSCLVIGPLLAANKGLSSDAFTGAGLTVVGLIAFLISLVWAAVEAANRDAIDEEIETLEAQQRKASSSVGVTPWAREGAGGLALSLPLP